MNKSIKGFFLSFSSVISDKSPYPLKENFLKPHGWRTWLIFWGLLVITVATTFLAGGFMFSISLLFILGTHEFGHYWASRKNHVRASLPFFIPAPPVFIAGTFGAFILIKDPIPNRRVLMEIGAAGPIAGFLVAVPTLIVGLYLSKIEPFQGIIGVSYGNSILLAILSKLILGVNPSAENINVVLHPIAFAGWIGMFVTALNLLPIGQLDGGHVIYALFKGQFTLLNRIFFFFLIPLGYLWNGWWFWALLVAGVGFRHAPLIDETTPLDKWHYGLGYTALFILLVTFIPVPFEFLTF